MAEGKPDEILISFESGHYKKIKGEWEGDSVWTHFKKAKGGHVHVNKDKVEYYETFDIPELGKALKEMVNDLRGRVASLEAREEIRAAKTKEKK